MASYEILHFTVDGKKVTTEIIKMYLLYSITANKNKSTKENLEDLIYFLILVSNSCSEFAYCLRYL